LIMDLDGPTGGSKWQQTTNTNNLFDKLAVGPNGTVYTIEVSCVQQGINTASCLDSLDANSGAVINQIQLPTSSTSITGFDCSTENISATTAGTYSQPIVAPDGSVYLENESYVFTWPSCTSPRTVTETLSLLKNGTPTQTLSTYAASGVVSPGGYIQPGHLIPNGNGAWPVAVSEGRVGTGDITNVVQDVSIDVHLRPTTDCGDWTGGTIPYSTVGFRCVTENTQWALNITITNAQQESAALQSQNLIQAIGRAVGNISAHEIAHQFLGLCCGMEAKTSQDPNAAGTYNNGVKAGGAPTPY
jgi:hypothetical protein